MELWGWLTPWWNWWAGFSDLFDWEAISAVATAAALIWALWTAVGAQRKASEEARRRSVGLMKALLMVSGSGVQVVKVTLADGAKLGLSAAQCAQQALDVDNFNELQRSLDTFSPSDLHSTAAIDLLMSARTGIANLRKRLQEQAAGEDVGGMVSGLLAYWERLLLGIAAEVVRLGGQVEGADNEIAAFWITKAMSKQAA